MVKPQSVSCHRAAVSNAHHVQPRGENVVESRTLCAIHPACACLVNQKTDHLQDQDQQKKAKGRRQNSCQQDDALFLTHSSPPGEARGTSFTTKVESPSSGVSFPRSLRSTHTGFPSETVGSDGANEFLVIIELIIRVYFYVEYKGCQARASGNFVRATAVSSRTWWRKR